LCAGLRQPSWQAQLMGEAMEYACHYCGRTDGQRTKDHKVPKVFGGKLLGPDNIVLCCRMCNMIKSARHYGMFVALFGEFLELHGEQYLAANPDDARCHRVMSRKFRSWLKQQQAPLYEEHMPRRRGADPQIASAAAKAE